MENNKNEPSVAMSPVMTSQINAIFIEDLSSSEKMQILFHHVNRELVSKIREAAKENNLKTATDLIKSCPNHSIVLDYDEDDELAYVTFDEKTYEQLLEDLESCCQLNRFYTERQLTQLEIIECMHTLWEESRLCPCADGNTNYYENRLIEALGIAKENVTAAFTSLIDVTDADIYNYFEAYYLNLYISDEANIMDLKHPIIFEDGHVHQIFQGEY